jgi:hypothetical protein
MSDSAIEDLPGLGLVDDIDTPIDDTTTVAESSPPAAVDDKDAAGLERSQRKAARKSKGEAKKADHRRRMEANNARAAVGDTKKTKVTQATVTSRAGGTVLKDPKLPVGETKEVDSHGGVGECGVGGGGDHDDGGLIPMKAPLVAGGRPTCEKCQRNLASVALQETTCR